MTAARNLTTRRLSEVTLGEELPALEIPLTATVIIAGAIASRDYQDVHHDPGLAQERGSKDIFMNILTTNGLVGRYITDWAGPDAVIRGLSVKLGTPNVPGDTMTFQGKVAALTGDEAKIEVVGKNSWGNHVTGTVRVVLPR